MNRISSSLALLAAAVLVPSALHAQPLSESFDAGVPAGWLVVNHSNAAGSTSWFLGNTAVFGPQGSAGYVAANFNSAGDGGTVSNWLVSPQLTNLQNGQTLTFYTSAEAGAPAADRLQARLCLGDATACQNVGTNEADFGNFTTVLSDINPTYAVGGFPSPWSQQGVTLTGLPAGANQGRIAFRYMAVTSGPGPTGTGGDYIGIDTLNMPAGIAAIAITKTASNASPGPGVPFTYSIVVTNTGAGDATGVAITDNVPAGLAIGTVTITPTGTCGVAAQAVSCSVPLLAAGTSVTVTIPVTASSLGTFSNTATATGVGLGPVSATATVAAALAPVPTLPVSGIALLGLALAAAGFFVMKRPI